MEFLPLGASIFIFLFWILTYSFLSFWFLLLVGGKKSTHYGCECRWTFLPWNVFLLCLCATSLCYLTLAPLSFAPPNLLSISVWYLETKVECKRQEAASVSSFFTKISPRYNWLPLLQRRHANHLWLNNWPTSTVVLLFWRGLLQENKKNIYIFWTCMLWGAPKNVRPICTVSFYSTNKVWNKFNQLELNGMYFV